MDDLTTKGAGRPSCEVPNFITEYFVQTRREIDTEKHERDRLLHFAIILLGGLAVITIQRVDFPDVVSAPESILGQVGFLVILTALFWLRFKKLTQIADRWLALHRLARDYGGADFLNLSLEKTVIAGFKARRYIRKDLILALSFSFPIYLLLVRASWQFFHGNAWIRGTLLVLVVSLHILASWLLQWRSAIRHSIATELDDSV